MKNLYSEILIDHTSLHAIIGRQSYLPEYFIGHFRELCRFIEYTLLADVVFICNTVTPETMDVTQRALELFLKHGLTNPRGDKKFRTGTFTHQMIRDACTGAAHKMYEDVHSFNVKDLRAVSTVNSDYLLRPLGAQNLNFRNVANIPFGTDKTEEYIQEYIPKLGWGPTSCIPLLNSNLYVWFQGIAKQIRSDFDAAFSTINTISRWKFNEQLSSVLSTNDAAVRYIPSYGRAEVIDQFLRHTWEKNLEDLEKFFNKKIRENEVLEKIFVEMAPTAEHRLPVLGMWVVSKLPENPTFEHLIEQIVALQSHKYVTELKRYIFTDTLLELDRINRDITREIKAYKKVQPKGALDQVLIETSVKIPLPFIEFTSGNKRTVPELLHSITKRFDHPVTTLLTGFIKDIVPLATLKTDVFDKAKSVLYKKT